jgi:hypothetical protein
MILSLFGAWIIKWVLSQIHSGIDALRTWWATKDLGWISKVGNDFLDKIEVALDNHIHLDAAIANSIADGTVTSAEWATISAAAWEDVKANLSIKDWHDLGALLIPGFSQKSTGRDEVEKVVKAKFMANAKRMAAASADKAVTRGITRSLMKQSSISQAPFSVGRTFQATTTSTSLPGAPTLGNSSGPSSRS